MRGRQETSKPLLAPLFRERRQPIEGVAVQLAEPPALDGTLEASAARPLTLDHEDQYRRSEEPYPGPEEFAATAYVNWTDEALYIGVDVVKSTLVIRPPDAAAASSRQRARRHPQRWYPGLRARQPTTRRYTAS